MPLDGTRTADFLRALTRVLWRELLDAGRVRIIVEWDQDPGLQNIEIQDPAGAVLVGHTVQASVAAVLVPDMWPEISYASAEPSADWLAYLVDGWLASDDDELLDAGMTFPGVDGEAWDDLDDDEALDLARAAVARLSQAIESEDVAELKTWATNVPINGGWYSEAVVGRWDDAMVWRSLDLPTKGEIRRLLADLYDSDPANGCNGLLLLADLADL